MSAGSDDMAMALLLRRVVLAVASTILQEKCKPCSDPCSHLQNECGGTCTGTLQNAAAAQKGGYVSCAAASIPSNVWKKEEAHAKASVQLWVGSA